MNVYQMWVSFGQGQRKIKLQQYLQNKCQNILSFIDRSKYFSDDVKKLIRAKTSEYEKKIWFVVPNNQS